MAGSWVGWARLANDWPGLACRYDGAVDAIKLAVVHAERAEHKAVNTAVSRAMTLEDVVRATARALESLGLGSGCTVYTYDPDTDALVVVVDAANLDNHLRFTLQLIALGLPVVVALNMVDLAERDGLTLFNRSASVCAAPDPAGKGVGALVTALAEKGALFSICCTVLACKWVSYSRPTPPRKTVRLLPVRS